MRHPFPNIVEVYASKLGIVREIIDCDQRYRLFPELIRAPHALRILYDGCGCIWVLDFALVTR